MKDKPVTWSWLDVEQEVRVDRVRDGACRVSNGRQCHYRATSWRSDSELMSETSKRASLRELRDTTSASVESTNPLVNFHNARSFEVLNSQGR